MLSKLSDQATLKRNNLAITATRNSVTNIRIAPWPLGHLFDSKMIQLFAM